MTEPAALQVMPNHLQASAEELLATDQEAREDSESNKLDFHLMRASASVGSALEKKEEEEEKKRTKRRRTLGISFMAEGTEEQAEDWLLFLVPDEEVSAVYFGYL